MIQWLALADAKQCDSMVQSCIRQLVDRADNDTVHAAFASPHLSQLLDGLRPETSRDITRRLLGLPAGHKVGMLHVHAMYIMHSSMGSGSVA